jgi:glutamate-1-semialdehyde 2,1-aminomutase
MRSRPMTDTALRNTDIDAALNEAKERYVTSAPASLARYVDATTVMPGGNTRTVLHFEPFPLAFARGEGPYLWSLDGRRYTDLLGEFTAGLYGHSEPVILDAVRSALERGIGYGGTNDLEQQLAGLLCDRFPSMDLVRFTNSGTEANLMALALAVHMTGRPGVLAFRGAYHGGVLTFGDMPSAANVPHRFVLCDYGDLDATREVIRAHAAEVGAIIVEPMLGAGGCVPASTEFLRMLRTEADACGAVLIFDEVMTSRLSRGGVQQLENVIPDLTTLGKYLAGGMSFGAFGGREELMRYFDPTVPGGLAHAGTFNNNVLSMSAGIAGLKHVLTDDALAALNARGDRLHSRLNAAAHDHDVAVHTSGRGSLLTIHPASSPVVSSATPQPAQSLARELLFLELLDAGFWTARRGMIALCLPITDTHCDAFATAFDDVLGRHEDLLRTHLGPAG